MPRKAKPQPIQLELPLNYVENFGISDTLVPKKGTFMYEKGATARIVEWSLKSEICVVAVRTKWFRDHRYNFLKSELSKYFYKQ